jgi:hypothetical protein
VVALFASVTVVCCARPGREVQPAADRVSNTHNDSLRMVHDKLADSIPMQHTTTCFISASGKLWSLGPAAEPFYCWIGLDCITAHDQRYVANGQGRKHTTSVA